MTSGKASTELQFQHPLNGKEKKSCIQNTVVQYPGDKKQPINVTPLPLTTPAIYLLDSSVECGDAPTCLPCVCFIPKLLDLEVTLVHV